MKILRWLGGWMLLIAGVLAWAFAFSGPDGDWWLYAVRYGVGFAGLPLLVASLFTFYDGWGTPIR